MKLSRREALKAIAIAPALAAGVASPPASCGRMVQFAFNIEVLGYEGTWQRPDGDLFVFRIPLKNILATQRDPREVATEMIEDLLFDRPPRNVFA